MKSLGAALVEIHGQHDERALVDAGTHRALLDAFGGLDRDAQAVTQLWEERRAREAEVAAHRAAFERAQREADWLRHAVEELTRLAPEPSEETALADRRAAMMQAEKVAGDLRDAHEAVAGAQSPVPALAAAVRRLERRATQAPALIEPAAKALDAALSALEDARAHLEEALRVADHDPHELERIEERLFALRAAARKYNVPLDGLSALATRHAAEFALIDAGAERLAALETPAVEAVARYRTAAAALSTARRKTADKLDKAVNGELKPLKLERAKFSTEIAVEPEEGGPHGIDRVEFWVCTNPGTRPGPLMKIASGGELARFLLALKVVLADRGSAPTLVFDEIDTGVGGAVADAIGVRLARLAAPRPGDRGYPCAPGRGACRPPLSHQQERARQGQARRHARFRSRSRTPPRGNRPHARRRRDHRRSPRRRRAPDQGGGLTIRTFHLRTAYHGRYEMLERRGSHLLHGSPQLDAQQFKHALDAWLTECAEAPKIGPADGHALRADAQRLYDVAAAAKAGVDEDRHRAGHLDDFGQCFDRRAAAILAAAAVIGDDDGVDAVVGGDLGILLASGCP